MIDFDPAKPDVDAVVAGLADAIAAYRADYAAYYDRCKHPTIRPAIRDPNAVVYLIPGVGMFTFAKDKATARISGEFYVNAINVMRGASTVSTYQGLPEQEAFDIEYWLLEEAKLQRMPKPKSLAGQIALVTGGAGGIGKATAARLLREGACVVLADIDETALAAANEELGKVFGKDFVRPVNINVTKEDAGHLRLCRCRRWNSAASTSSSPMPASPPRRRSRRRRSSCGTRTWTSCPRAISSSAAKPSACSAHQKIGGNVVFVASKNGLAASPNAAAYCTAKAAEIHLARCLALEGADEQIRVNVVNPDAVLRGSKIWAGEWLEQRASTYKTDKDGLEEMYRQRSMLKRSRLPRGHRRSHLLLRLRHLGQIHRQHHQRRRRQRPDVHAVA